MPQARRQEPLHLQIAGYYKKEITEGRLHYRDRLPSIRDIRRSWTDSDGGPIGQNTAQRAIEYLRTEGLVTTGSEGTFVAEPRAAIGPQQRMRLAAVPVSERQQVTAAELTEAPAYVLPVLGLEPGSLVVRREWVTWEGDQPVRLSVSWCRPLAAAAVPALLDAEPLPDPRGAAALIAEATGLLVADLAGYAAFECRRAHEDGRELPLLRIDPGSFVLAGVWTWRSPGPGGDVIEYGEYILPPGRVIESTLEP
jgi:DNA-binding transcriptional regulator YhcF (GntR family)